MAEQGAQKALIGLLLLACAGQAAAFAPGAVPRPLDRVCPQSIGRVCRAPLAPLRNAPEGPEALGGAQEDWQMYLDPKTKTRGVIPEVVPIVGNPQQTLMDGRNYTIDAILRELAAIQQQGPKTYCILGTRHCSYLHQQIIELLAYALVLSGNHVYTSGAGGTNAAVIRGALRADNPELLTVVLPQSIMRQPPESQKLLDKVKNVIEMLQNDHLSLDVASRLCNSDLLSRTEQLIAFAFHNSNTVIEATKEAQSLEMVVTVLYLD